MFQNDLVLTTPLHNLQLQHMQTHRANEMDAISNELLSARNETSMQGALIISMTHKITTLEHQIEDAHANSDVNNQLENMSTASSSGIQHSKHSRHSRHSKYTYDDKYVTDLLQRVHSAEAALARITAIPATHAASPSLVHNRVSPSTTPHRGMCEDSVIYKELQQENAQLTQALHSYTLSSESHAHEQQKLRDQLAYYRDENIRLERQVELMGRDLTAMTPAAAASPRTQLERVIFRPSEKESKRTIRFVSERPV